MKTASYKPADDRLHNNQAHNLGLTLVAILAALAIAYVSYMWFMGSQRTPLDYRSGMVVENTYTEGNVADVPAPAVTPSN